MVERLTASVFSTLPTKFHHQGEPTEWAKAVRPGRDIHSFLEGPAFDRHGNLYLSDIPHGRIFRVTPNGEWDIAVEYDGQPNGIAIHRDGALFVADCLQGILRIEPTSGEVASVCASHHGAPFAGCSDLFFSAEGELYFTDAGFSSLVDPSGRVYRLSSGGQLAPLCDNIPYPNGIVFNADESELLVSATRANAVWRFAPDGPGPLMVGLFVQLSGGLGPDGLALDAEGRLVVAHARAGSVWIFDSNGEPAARIDTDAKSVTNVAFGGADNRTLFITEADSGTVYSVTLDVPGKKMFSHS